MKKALFKRPRLLAKTSGSDQIPYIQYPNGKVIFCSYVTGEWYGSYHTGELKPLDTVDSTFKLLSLL